MHGTLDRLVVESDALADNPLGDPARRPLYVYRPPGVELDHPRALPSVYVIQGYTGQLDMWFTRQPFEPTMIERIDALFAAGECPDAIVVFVDAWTSFGGSQFLELHRHGPLHGLPVRRGRRRSSTSATRRPPTATTAGWRASRAAATARWSCRCCARTCSARSPRTPATRCSRPATCPSSRPSRASCATSSTARARSSSSARRAPTARHGTASARSSSTATRPPTRPTRRNPGKALLPVRPRHGPAGRRRVGAVAGEGPGADGAAHADALRSMRRIYLDAGPRDEYFLDLGRQAFARRARASSASKHTVELFDGTHGGIACRYPGAIRELVTALAPLSRRRRSSRRPRLARARPRRRSRRRG